jgi:hypothetical protein
MSDCASMRALGCVVCVAVFCVRWCVSLCKCVCVCCASSVPQLAGVNHPMGSLLSFDFDQFLEGDFSSVQVC